MDNYNFGAIKRHVFENAKSNKGLIKKFAECVKKSDILKHQFLFFNNMENKNGLSEATAIRYIDKNIALINNYTKKQIKEANAALLSYLGLSDISPNVVERNIQNLIYESAKNKNPNVDVLHESFENILAKITVKEDSESLLEQYGLKDDLSIPYEVIVESAVNKFNQKYATSLDAFDKKIVKLVSENNTSELSFVFNDIKKDVISTLRENVVNTTDSETKITLYEAIDKVHSMEYNEQDGLKELLKINKYRKDIK